MKFLKTFLKALTDRHFYKSIIAGEQKTGFWYLAKLHIISSLFLTTLLSIGIAYGLPRLENFATHLLPEGSEIIIKDGVLKTNTNPLVYPIMDKEFQNRVNIKRANYFVLDITASSTLQDLEKRDAYVLVTSDGFVTQNPSNGKITINQFANSVKNEEVIINKETLVHGAHWLKNAAKVFPFIAFVGIWIGLYVLSLISSLAFGLFVFIMCKIMKNPKPFGIAFSVALYARTFAVVLALFSFVFAIFALSSISIILQLIFLTLMIRRTEKVLPPLA